MALNDFNTTVGDGALGIGQVNADNVIVAVGACGGGTANTVTDLLRKADTIKSTLVSGPLVEASCYHVVTSKQPLYCVPVNASVAGASSSITRSNGASPVITKSGTAKDSYSVSYEILSDGVIASGTASGSYRYTVDGGDTYSAEIAIPSASTTTTASTTGSTDMTTGGLFGGGGTLNNKQFSINHNGGGATTVTFSSPANAAAVVTAINTALGATVASIDGSNHLKLTSTVAGSGGSIVLAAGSPDALAVLGLTAGTYSGVTGTSSVTLGDTGITLTLPLGTYTKGDTYTFTTSEPSYVLGDLTDALDAIVAASRLDYFLIHVVGAASSAANARAIAESLVTYAEDFALVHKFVEIVMACPSVDVAVASALRTEFEGFGADTENRRVAIVYPYVELESEATKENGKKRVFERSLAWPLIARLASISISESAAWVGRGKLAGVKLVQQTYLDEADAMDDAGFVTVREVVGKTGYFINNHKIMTPEGSDFQFGEYRRIMDAACRVARERGVNYLNGKLLASKATGFITETSARGVEDDIGGALQAKLVPEHADEATVVVARDEDIIKTQSFSLTTRIVPPAYGRAITHDIAFINPAATG